jgi:hypothetical protein
MGGKLSVESLTMQVYLHECLSDGVEGVEFAASLSSHPNMVGGLLFASLSWGLSGHAPRQINRKTP